MKNRKIFSILIALTLALCFLFQDTYTIQNDQEVDNKEEFLFSLSTSESIEYQWNVSWGESAIDETARALALDSLGNIYLAGFTNKTVLGDYDMCLVKFNDLGQYQWNRTWGRSYADVATGIVIDSSDNIYIGGISETSPDSEDICLLKYNPLGEYQWNSTWGGSNREYAFGIALDSSENIYLAGYAWNSMSWEDMCIVKFNSFGEYQWNITWGGPYNDMAYSIVVDSSDNLYLVGDYTIVDDINSDFCVVKFNNFGIYQWNTTLGGNNFDPAFDLALDSLKNIYIVGTWNMTVNPNLGLVKLDNSGKCQWNRTFGGIYFDIGTTITVDSLGNIYIGGTTDCTGSSNLDFFLIECDNLGFQKWNHTWGGSGTDVYWGIVLDSLENVYLGGVWDMAGPNPNMILTKFEKVEIPTPPENFMLYSTADEHDDEDGVFDLYWDSAEGAVDYSVYEYSSFITEFNGSLTVLASVITDLTLPLSGYSDGTYFFIVVAQNDYGDTLSNCIRIDVQIPVIVDTITVTAPVVTDSWETGSTHSITWTSTGSITHVTIELRKGGMFKRIIVISTPNDGIYSLIIPTDIIDGTDYQIRICDAWYPATYDDSPNFTITSADTGDGRDGAPGIPGYDLIIFLVVFSVAMIIIIKKKYKFLE